MGGNRQDEQIGVEVDEITTETTKAILVVWEGKKHWIPRSQIHDIKFGNGREGDPNELTKIIVTPWIAKEKGFI